MGAGEGVARGRRNALTILPRVKAQGEDSKRRYASVVTAVLTPINRRTAT